MSMQTSMEVRKGCPLTENFLWNSLELFVIYLSKIMYSILLSEVKKLHIRIDGHRIGQTSQIFAEILSADCT